MTDTVVRPSPPTLPFDSRRLAPLVARVRAEYLESPGLSLTSIQARRLFGLSPGECHGVFDRLVQDGFLRSAEGMFRRTGAA
ncbi:MAG: hypothetical protein AB7U83_19995 [Vicinamibacterales bacterium]